MADQQLYVATNGSAPVYRDHHLHPFGQEFGHMYTNYTTFVAGAPDTSMFDIPNLKYCQRGDDAQCGSSSNRFTRLVAHLRTLGRAI